MDKEQKCYLMKQGKRSSLYLVREDDRHHSVRQINMSEPLEVTVGSYRLFRKEDFKRLIEPCEEFDQATFERMWEHAEEMKNSLYNQLNKKDNGKV